MNSVMVVPDYTNKVLVADNVEDSIADVLLDQIVPLLPSTTIATSTEIAALPTDADVNAACDTALTDYDAPTKAEMDSAFTALAAAVNVARNGIAFTLTFPIYKNDGTLITGAAGLDSEISKDLGTFEDCTNEATELATNSGQYYLTLTATEMAATQVAVTVKTSSTAAVIPTFNIYPK